MIRSRPIRLCAALCALFLHPATLPAQSHRRGKPTASPATTPDDPSARHLATLLVAQRQALTTGDPLAVAQATRPLLGQLLQEMAKLRLVQGKTPDAVDLYRRSLQQVDSPDTHLELAATLMRTGKPQEAADETMLALNVQPKNAAAWAMRGSALRLAADEKGASDAFSRSLDLEPEVNVAYALGSSLLAQHEKEKANRVFEQIIAASGDAAIWHVAVGDAYREALYLSEAAEEFKKAIAIDPRVGHAEFFLGLTYLQMNQWGPDSRSFQHLREAVRLAPHEYVSNFYLGALESTDGSDLAASDRHLHAAADADPSSPEVWLYLGINAGRERQTAAAKTYLTKAIDLTGADEARNNYQVRRAYFALGRILIAEGNRTEGDALLAKYKRTEQQALSNSASAIAHAAGDEARSALGSIQPVKPSFPGMKSPDAPNPNEPSAFSTPATHTPEETRNIAASEQKLDELLAAAFNDLGTAEARQGQYQPALADFQQAEMWHSPAPALLRSIGAAAFRLGNYTESARAVQLYLESEQGTAQPSSQDDRSHMMLAMSLFSLGRFADADKAFNSISAVTLQDPRAAYSWAYSLAHSGQQQHANQIADVLAKQPLPSDVMSLVCHLYMDTENYEGSVACYRRAYQADPTLRLAHYQAAESLIRLDRPADAVAELKQELALDPGKDNPDVQYSLAFALLQTSHKPEAMSILESLTAAHPTHAQAQYQLGKALLEDGKIAPSIEHLELAEQNDPAPDYIHYQLQAAYRKAGRTEDADRELRLYRDIKSRNREVTPPQK